MNRTILTQVMVISDTHGLSELPTKPNTHADVLIHCGDLTESSKLAEFANTIALLKTIDAPLKLIIAGNHDWTLDDSMFATKLIEAHLKHDDPAVLREYGRTGEAEALLRSQEDIVYLKQGTHRFKLHNGAELTVYTSPYTPSVNDWGFQYDPASGHAWEIMQGTDIAITHGPPRGILDMAAGKRAGCPDLFTAIARTQPRVHCFGHIHSAWGARNVCWRKQISAPPSHFAAIDNEDDATFTLASMAALKIRQFDSEDDRVVKRMKREPNETQGFYTAKVKSDIHKPSTLFVNAAIEKAADVDEPAQLPWLIEIDLPEAISGQA